MMQDQFRRCLDSHGADLARWPDDVRGEAERMIAGDAAALGAWNAARRIDELVVRHLDAGQSSDGVAVARVLAALASPLPRQKRRLLSRLPELLLDWQFAPAWPRMAALACCAALGLMIGFSGIDRQFDGLNPTTAQPVNLASAVFAPEALTGARP